MSVLSQLLDIEDLVHLDLADQARIEGVVAARLLSGSNARQDLAAQVKRLLPQLEVQRQTLSQAELLGSTRKLSQATDS